MYQALRDDQREHLEQAAQVWLTHGPLLRVQEELAGGMQWKTAKGAEYLVRHWNDPVTKTKKSRSLGARSPDNERRYERFYERKQALELDLERHKPFLDEFAKRSKKLRMPSLPFLATRVCHQLHARGFGLGEVLLINEASRYAYEAHFCVGFEDYPSLGLVLNETIMPVETWTDLLLTSADFDIEQDGLSDAILRSVRGMERHQIAFVASPAAGPMVVTPYTISSLLNAVDDRCRPGAKVLDAIEWALHEPIIRSVAIGDDGQPVPVLAPDPRALIFTSYAMATVTNRNAFYLRRSAMGLATLWADGQDEPFLSEHIELFPELEDLHAEEPVGHIRI